MCGCAAQRTAINDAKGKPFIGVWISCYELDKMLSGGNFKKEFSATVKGLKELGVNNAFVHTTAFADSLFDSKYYKRKQITLSYDFDVLEYIIKRLNAAGIAAHAWINPFRTAPGEFLDPADPDTRALVLGGIREITDNYNVAGIHFDDYFYPADNESIDKESYAKYKSEAKSPLSKADWRRANISALIFAVKDLLNSKDSKIVFSISPAADIAKNRDTYFADISGWFKEGVTDYIIPQLYFGFDYPDKNFCFGNLLDSWKAAATGSKTKLVIGLAAYKLGTNNPPDNAEWEGGTDILSRQTKICLDDGAISGVCYFSCSYLLSEKKLNTAARVKIKEILPS